MNRHDGSPQGHGGHRAYHGRGGVAPPGSPSEYEKPRRHECIERQQKRRFGKMRHYVGARLHRRLFMAMGWAIFSTILACALILHFFADSPWRRDGLKDIERFFSARFAEVWEEPAARSRLATDAAQTFRVGLSLLDEKGQALGHFGAKCKGTQFSFPVTEGGRHLGQVGVCPEHHIRFEKTSLFVLMGTAGVILWLFAGLMARKLGMPLLRLTEVTQEIGEGKLSARARLGRQHTGEVGLLASSINDMAERIERQVRGQRELLAGVSHEIRTPLSRLRVLTEILRERNVSEKHLANIEREIDEINDLTGQLLASSRLEFETLDRLRLQPVEIARTLLSRFGLSDSVLEVEGTPRDILGDATLLGRALTNLLENAKTHGEGLKTLRVSFESTAVRFSAMDEGPGFKEADLPKVFDSFYRGTGSGKGTSSLGLGLALVRRIAQAHGGDAHAENRPANADDRASPGASVSFTVPYAEEDSVREDT
jgi:two-component system OmpR family sensor kinase